MHSQSNHSAMSISSNASLGAGTSSSTKDDDDSVLELSEQTLRPLDVALHQQRIQAWHPILDPVWVILGLLYLGVIMVPVGFKVDQMQEDVVEIKRTYDAYDDPNATCGINTTYNANRTCLLSLEVPSDMAAPVLVHYELTNFHQNHRNYFQSRDDFQLFGQVGNQDAVSRENCEPLNKLGNVTINPCGLIANTFFNDILVLQDGQSAEGDALELIETGIAWTSDLQFRYAQPDGFHYDVCDACTVSCCEGDQWSCSTPYVAPNGTCFSYFYPRDDETLYLYESYPDIISPIEGVTNEHFVVWMRVATQPTFRKLYGWINQDIAAGTTVTFRVQANYVVQSFRGSKSLILSTNNIFGGRNPYLAPVLYGVGFFCLAAGVFFALKHAIWPRKLAADDYLHYKEE